MQVGAGVTDLGNFGVMPVGELEPYMVSGARDAYRSPFSHDTEVSQPGYYSVLLEKFGIRAELTATARCGVHRYTFPSSELDVGHVLIDVSHTLVDKAAKFVNVTLEVTATGELKSVSGMIVNGGDFSTRVGGMVTYFVAQFNATASAYGIFANGTYFPQLLHASGSWNGAPMGAYVSFPITPGCPVVELVLCISYVSVEQARLNLQSDVGLAGTGTQLFAPVRAATQAVWNQQLSILQLNASADDPSLATVAYTALYHVLLAPSNYTEAGGVHLGFDKKVHTLPPGRNTYFSDVSIWDVYRTQLPLLALIRPDLSRELIASFADMVEQGGGAVPQWPFGPAGDARSMSGSHTAVVLADALAKNAVNIQIDSSAISTVYSALWAQANSPDVPNPRPGLESWLSLGYVAFSATSGPSIAACLTLEFAYDDFCLSYVASALGRSNDSAVLLERSSNYRNIFDSSRGFFCPREASGAFACPKSFTELWLVENPPLWEEGDGWQYRLSSVPHDLPGIISLLGGNESFSQGLQYFMNESLAFPSNVLPNPYYWAGNEPDILAPWLFGPAGRLDLTQYWTRSVLSSKYTSHPSGIPGNDEYPSEIVDHLSH
jgi:predicted alpha-1,2-mannosidase